MAGSVQKTSATSTEPEVAIEVRPVIIFPIIRRTGWVKVLTNPLYPTAVASASEQM